MGLNRIRAFIEDRPATSLAIILGCGLALILGLFHLAGAWEGAAYQPVRRAAAALEKGDLDAAMATLSPTAYRGALSKQELRRLAQRVTERYGPLRLVLTRHECRRQGPVALCDVGVIGFPSGAGGRPVHSRWVVTLEWGPDRWYVTDLEPIMIDGREVDGLDALPGMLR